MKPPLPLHKTIKDFKFCLDHIEEITKRCTPAQKQHISMVLGSLIILVWGFKKGTHMGELIVDFRKWGI